MSKFFETGKTAVRAAQVAIEEGVRLDWAVHPSAEHTVTFDGNTAVVNITPLLSNAALEAGVIVGSRMPILKAIARRAGVDLNTGVNTTIDAMLGFVDQPLEERSQIGTPAYLAVADQELLKQKLNEQILGLLASGQISPEEAEAASQKVHQNADMLSAEAIELAVAAGRGDISGAAHHLREFLRLLSDTSPQCSVQNNQNNQQTDADGDREEQNAGENQHGDKQENDDHNPRNLNPQLINIEQHRPQTKRIEELARSLSKLIGRLTIPAHLRKIPARTGKRIRRRVLEQSTPTTDYPLVRRQEEVPRPPKLLIYIDGSGTMSFERREIPVHMEYVAALTMALMDHFDVTAVMHNGSEQYKRVGGYVIMRNPNQVIETVERTAICCGEGRVPLIDGDYSAVIMLTDMGWGDDAIRDYNKIVDHYMSRRALTAVHGYNLQEARAALFASDRKLVLSANGLTPHDAAVAFFRVLEYMHGGR